VGNHLPFSRSTFPCHRLGCWRGCLGALHLDGDHSTIGVDTVQRLNFQSQHLIAWDWVPTSQWDQIDSCFFSLCVIAMVRWQSAKSGCAPFLHYRMCPPRNLGFEPPSCWRRGSWRVC
jgi:hypothetical protein